MKTRSLNANVTYGFIYAVVWSALLAVSILAYLQVSGGLYGNFQIAFIGAVCVILTCFAVIVSAIAVLTFFGLALLITLNGFKQRGKRA